MQKKGAKKRFRLVSETQPGAHGNAMKILFLLVRIVVASNYHYMYTAHRKAHLGWRSAYTCEKASRSGRECWGFFEVRDVTASQMGITVDTWTDFPEGSRGVTLVCSHKRRQKEQFEGKQS